MGSLYPKVVDGCSVIHAELNAILGVFVRDELIAVVSSRRA
jgi:hypothetical protein